MRFLFSFFFLRQLFHLFLADWGFPSLGIERLQAGCGIAPTIIFPVSFSGKKWVTSSWTLLHWHRARSTDRREDSTVLSAPSLSNWLCLSLSPVFLILSVFGDSSSHSTSVNLYFCFHHHPYLCTALSPAPHLHSFFLFLKRSPVTQAILQRMP